MPGSDDAALLLCDSIALPRNSIKSAISSLEILCSNPSGISDCEVLVNSSMFARRSVYVTPRPDVSEMLAVESAVMMPTTDRPEKSTAVY